MADYYYTFRSVTAAMSASKVLEKAGIRLSPTRTPERLRHHGCGYSLRVSERLFPAVRALLPEDRYQRLFRREGEEWKELEP